MKPENNDTKTDSTASEVGCSDLLASFGSMMLDEILQGEFEPDSEWLDKMRDNAEARGLIATRLATQEDDPAEYDYVYERVVEHPHLLANVKNNRP